MRKKTEKYIRDRCFYIIKRMSLEFYNSTVDFNELWYESHRNLVERMAIEFGQGDKVDELVEKYLGPQVRFKKRKDPKAPKKPLTGYLHFCAERRSKLSKKYPTLKMTELSSKLGELWKGLPANKRKTYEQMHEADKDRYASEMEEYMAAKMY